MRTIPKRPSTTRPSRSSSLAPLKKVEWANPHVWFYVDVTDDDGKVTTWGFSTQPPGALMRRGVTKEALKIGAVVNVEGVRARDGSNNASMRRLTFTDGTQVLDAGGWTMKTRSIGIAGARGGARARGGHSRARAGDAAPVGRQAGLLGHLHAAVHGQRDRDLAAI